jgi:hypothetical protein
MEKIKELTFGGQEIHVGLENTDIMINATEMGKCFGKLPKDFLGTEQTQNFISALCRKDNIPFDKVVMVSKGGKNLGTWMHRKLALKFASWLSSDFELWVYDVIEKIMFGEAQVLRDNNDELRVIINRINEIDKEYSIIGKERYQLAKRQKELLNINVGLLHDN